MLWLGIDTETTGLDTEKDRIVELGAVLWDWETGSPVQIYNTLVESEVPISEEAGMINGISNDMVEGWGVPAVHALNQLCSMAIPAEYIVAHNAPFDQGMVNAELKRTGIDTFDEEWLDSAVDVPYPDTFKQRNLLYLAAMYEFVNPFPHRAVTDVLTMFKVLSKFDPHEIIEYSQAETVTLRAMVLKPWTDDGKSVGLAKSLGYRWDQAKKIWYKNVKDFEVEKETDRAKTLGFEAILINGKENDNAETNESN